MCSSGVKNVTSHTQDCCRDDSQLNPRPQDTLSSINYIEDSNTQLHQQHSRQANQLKPSILNRGAVLSSVALCLSVSVGSRAGVSEAADADPNEGDEDDDANDDSNDVPETAHGSVGSPVLVNKIVVVDESGHVVVIIIGRGEHPFKAHLLAFNYQPSVYLACPQSPCRPVLLAVWRSNERDYARMHLNLKIIETSKAAFSLCFSGRLCSIDWFSPFVIFSSVGTIWLQCLTIRSK